MLIHTLSIVWYFEWEPGEPVVGHSVTDSLTGCAVRPHQAMHWNDWVTRQPSARTSNAGTHSDVLLPHAETRQQIEQL